ncbi:MAG: hypothetical protein QOI24_971 [Acidobacteriota bacterium]|jgi:uncharacterized membrane protein (DUF2068 family)|nr:hypothetical protein [Acidobacteriota bacterium]
MADRDRNTFVRLIAVFRLLKAAALVVLAVNAPRLLSPAMHERLAHLLNVSRHDVLHRLIASVLHLSPQRVEELAIAMIAYALLFTVEGIGLWMGKVWAEYLTIVATASFIPFEIYEVMKRVSAARVSALVINIVIVIYLVLHRLHARRSL